MKRVVRWLSAGAVAAATLNGLCSEARAQSSCVVRGDAVMPLSSQIYDKASGGSPIARFTGGKISLNASAFPASRSGRARVSTGRSAGTVQIDGFVQAGDLPVRTSREVPVSQGHVWIGAHREVDIVGAGPGKLHVEKKVTAPMNQTFRAWAPCSSLTFTQTTPAGWTPPGHARGYVVKKDQVDLYTGAGGSHVTTLQRAGYGPGILLWSTNRSGPWVHVEFHGEVVIDAWARSRDLSALPPGETMDQLAPSVVKRGQPRLKVQGDTKVIRATQKAAVRGQAKESATVIGHVQPGAEIYLLDIVAGWASILPRELNVAPPAGEHFWVAAADLGL